VRFRRLALAISLLAALHGALYIPLVSTNIETDSWTYLASANALLDVSYTTPLKATAYYVYPAGWFDITGVPMPEPLWQLPERQVFRPPGYPLYLALFGKQERIFDGNHTPPLIGQALLFGAGSFLLMLAARRWWGERVAVLGALFYALDPWSKHYVPLVLSEVVAGFVLLVGLYAFTRAWETQRTAWWAAVGALAGAVTLVRAVFVLAVPLAILAALVAGDDTRARLRRAGAVFGAATILLAPWLAWTCSVLDRPVLASWGEGYNGLLAARGEGHGETAADVERSPAFRADLARAHELAPSTAELRASASAHPRYMRRADQDLRSQARHVYADRLANEPVDVFWDGLYRAQFLWSAHEDWYQPAGAARHALQALDLLVLLLALAGSALAFARGGPGRGVVVLLGTYTLVLATHHVEARFAMPLRGPFLYLVALVLVAGAARLRRV
jgi:4-amino-4-deoxy-L-arabinose transferase-like glycosyltransferase